MLSLLCEDSYAIYYNNNKKYKYTNTQILHNILVQDSWSSVGDATDSICSIWLLSPLLHAYKYQTMMQSFTMGDEDEKWSSLLMNTSALVVTHCFLWGGFSWDEVLKYKTCVKPGAWTRSALCWLSVISGTKTKWNWRTQFLGNFLQMTLELSFLLVTGHVD